MYTLKDRQKEAARAIDADLFQNNCNKVLASIATGWGKTILASKMFEKYIKYNNRRCLFVANRTELINQTIDKFKKASGLEVDIEKAEKEANPDSMAIVASCQTLADRLHKYRRDNFDFIVIDEAHGILCEQYQAILNHFDSKWLFLTATADKLCDQDLFQIIDKVSYEYTLKQSINEGYNVKPIVKRLKIEVPPMSDNDEENKLDLLMPEIIAQSIDTLRIRKTIMFLPSVERSKKTADMLKEYGINAIHCDGYMSEQERKKTLKKVAHGGPGTVVLNSVLLGTGYDQPDLDCCIILRNVTSRALYCQMVGRVLRTSPGKDHGLIIDVLGLTIKHNITASIEELNRLSNTVFDYSNFEQSTKEIDLLEQENNWILQAENKLAWKIIEQNEKTNFKRLLSYHTFCKLFRHSHFHGKTEINTAQINTINQLGVSVLGVENSENANKIIEVLKSRKEQGMASPKQVAYIFGMHIPGASTMTAKQASDIISRKRG